MDQKSQTCSACGAAMSLRLGRFECPACGQVGSAAPVAPAPSRARSSGGSAGQWDPGAQYRQAPPAEGSSPLSALAPESYAPPPAGAADTGENVGRRRAFGGCLVLMGVVGFILPLVHLQFKLFLLFGRFNLIAAGAAILIGAILAAVPDSRRRA
jgi:hypothetical protein